MVICLNFKKEEEEKFQMDVASWCCPCIYGLGMDNSRQGEAWSTLGANNCYNQKKLGTFTVIPDGEGAMPMVISQEARQLP